MSPAELSALVCVSIPNNSQFTEFKSLSMCETGCADDDVHHSLREGNEDVNKNDKKNTNEKAYDTKIETDNDKKDYVWSYDSRCICLLRILPWEHCSIH